MNKAQDTLLLSRVNAPKPPSHLYSRTRLLNLIKVHQERKLIFIASPAGYGKTTLVLDYLRSSSTDYAWINISENIDHVYSFFYMIVYALKNLEASFGEDTLSLLNSHLEKNKFNTNVKQSINDIILTLCRECNDTYKGKTSIVLDDYHHIEKIELKDYIVDCLIKSLPQTMQLIITSRQLPELDFIYYTLNNMMLKIEMEDLIFNKEESGALLLSKYNISNPEKISEITGKLGGWITGLHMVSQGYGSDIDSIEIDAQPIPENIFNFLAEKTFLKMEEQVKELLRVTSVIENFHEDLCIRLGLNNFRQNITKLLENNTFVQTIPISFLDGSEIISYNYPVLFRNYMQEKLKASKTGEEIKRIYRETSEYYYEKGDLTTAINYMIKAEEYSFASQEINKNFSEMFSEGKIEFLWTWLNALPSDHINKDANLLINLGILKKFYKGDLSGSLEYQDKAVKVAKENSDSKLYVKAIINRAILMLNLGKSSAVIKELELLLQEPSLAEFRFSLTYYLAYALFHASEYQKAEELLSEILQQRPEDDKLFNNALKLTGHIQLIRGNYLKSAGFYEKAVNDEKNIIDKFEVLCNLTLLSSQTGEYSVSQKYLKELDALIARFPTTVLKIPYQLARQAYFFETGDFESAFTILKSIYDESFSINHLQYKYLSSRLLTEALYYSKKYSEAKEYSKISRENLDLKNKLKKFELDVFDAILFDMTPGEKEKILLEAYTYYEENSLLLNLTQVSYFLASFYFNSGNASKTVSFLYKALHLAETNGYDSLLMREYRNDSRLLSSAFENTKRRSGFNRDYLESIIQRAYKKSPVQS